MTDSQLHRKNLADPTTVIVTDGSPEAEASVMRERLRAARESEEHCICWGRDDLCRVCARSPL